MFNEISVFILRRRKKKDKSFIIPAQALTAIEPLAPIELPVAPVAAVVTQLPEQAVQPVELAPVEIPVTEPVSPQVVPAVVEEDVPEYKAQSQEVNTTTSPQAEPIATAPVGDNPAESPALFAVDPIEPAAPVEKKVSALSLSSIRARKEMESSLEKKVVNPDDLPKEPFTAEQFMEEWNKYADKLARSGFMLMSSLMGMVPPVLRGTSVSLVMPNEGSKLSFDENKFDLVNYLRKKLSNYDLEIEITVNEEVKIQKRVLDKDDKLVRFIELNPAMQYMKEIFDLEFKY